VILPLGREVDKRSGRDPGAGNEEAGRHAEGVTGEAVVVRKAPVLEAVRRDLQVRPCGSQLCDQGDRGLGG